MRHRPSYLKLNLKRIANLCHAVLFFFVFVSLLLEGEKFNERKAALLIYLFNIFFGRENAFLYKGIKRVYFDFFYSRITKTMLFNC